MNFTGRIKCGEGSWHDNRVGCCLFVSLAVMVSTPSFVFNSDQQQKMSVYHENKEPVTLSNCSVLVCNSFHNSSVKKVNVQAKVIQYILMILNTLKIATWVIKTMLTGA